MKHLSYTIRLVVFLLSLSTAVIPSAVFSQQPIAPVPATVATAQTDLSKRQEAFQIVWQTVNDLFYDPKFGGVDWAAMRERYEPLVAKANDNHEFHLLLQQMLNELHQSHFLIVPRESIPKIRVTSATRGTDYLADSETNDPDTDEPLDDLRYKLTDRLLTGIGIDVRVLNGSAVVTRVAAGSSAARAGLRPGFVIKNVGGRSLDAVITEIENNPLWGAIIRPELPVFLVAGFINGEEAVPVRLRYLDARNRLRTISVKRERLSGEMSQAVGNLPALYTEFEAKRLPGGVGYIRFSAFVPLLMEKLCGALHSMKDAPGIILDLRGNQGGLLGMVGGLTGLLESTITSMGTMQTRTGRIPVFGFPQATVYSGPLVILVDGSTQSAGEMFASGMQEAGRATVVGQRSAGNTLPSAIKKLPTGALFQYGFANYETRKGSSLEGRGVTPNITVALTRKGLLRGGDPQLSAALRQVREEIRLSSDLKNVLATVTVPPSPPPPAAHAVVPPVRAAIAPPSARAVVTIAAEPKASDLPSVEAILEKYVEASGGRRALEKITNRVSTGTVGITALGVTGTVELIEQSPNKSSSIINAPGLGVMQKTFDGTRGWLQDPLQGFIRLTGLGLEMEKDSALFNKYTDLKKRYPSAAVVRKGRVGGKDVYMVLMGHELWHFDTESGLLLRRGNTYFEDYREVDGIKLPFRMRDDVFSGVGLIYQLKEIKHNVKIDEAKFAAYPSCFTKP